MCLILTDNTFEMIFTYVYVYKGNMPQFLKQTFVRILFPIKGNDRLSLFVSFLEMRVNLGYSARHEKRLITVTF